MSSKQLKNKQVAKNTLLLYFRMLFLMVVNLYTSRIILEALGVEDYGVYNAVAGFILMFSMVTSSIASAISRFLTYNLGKGEHLNLKKVFSTAIIIQFALAVIIVFLVEVVGVWFLNTHMTIPEGSKVAANWILQFALITFVLNLLSIPYNAALIAHEKMSAFAYIGIFEGCANLAISFIVMYSPCEKLIVYGAAMCLVATITRLIYSIYCKKHFDECSLHWTFDKSLFKEMFSFAGWNFIGSISGLLRDQGINILFNVYNGPIVNAARGLATQVQSAVTKFSHNFYTAVQPQITKSYASNNINESHDLVLRSSRLAFLLLIALIVPLLTETGYIIQLWLNEVPDHTVAFVKIIVINTLIDSWSVPIIQLMLATGNIKRYQIVVGLFNLLNFPVAWLVLYLTGTAETAQITVVFFSFGALILRVLMLNKMTHFPIRNFFISTIARCIFILTICVITSIIMVKLFQPGMHRFIINICTTELVFIILMFAIGFNNGERDFILEKARSIIRRQ